MSDNSPNSQNNTPAVVNHEIRQTYRGPIPPAEQFKKYNDVLPGAADRILQMTEAQSAHRRDIERWVVKGNQIKSIIALFLGFVMAMTLIVGGIYLIITDKQVSGLVSIGVTVGTILGTFLYTKKQQQKEDDEEDE